MAIGLDSHKIKLDFQKLDELPMASPLLQGLLNAIEDEEISIRQFSALIRQDVVLTARLVGLANSAYFGQSTPITSVDDAIFKSLGLRLAKSISLGIAMTGSYGSLKSSGIDIDRYWLKAILVASMSRALCTHLKVAPRPRPNTEVVYLSGLLHDFGLLPVVYLYGDDLSDLINNKETDIPLHLKIEQHLGFSYQEIGKLVAKKWQLPECIVEVIGHHHDLAYTGEYAQMVHLLTGVIDLVENFLNLHVYDLAHDSARYLIEVAGVEEIRLDGTLEEMQRKHEALLQVAHELSKS